MKIGEKKRKEKRKTKDLKQTIKAQSSLTILGQTNSNVTEMAIGAGEPELEIHRNIKRKRASQLKHKEK